MPTSQQTFLVNPSASGWIDKYIFILEKSHTLLEVAAGLPWYVHLQQTGFVYGLSVKPLAAQLLADNNFTKGELAKANLLHGLFNIFFTHKPSGEFEEALTSIVAFYRKLVQLREPFFRLPGSKQKPSQELEKLLTARIEDQKVQKPVNRITAHALLFADVLAYSCFLKKPKALDNFLEHLENTVMDLCVSALQAKTQKNEYDLLTLGLFQESDSLPDDMENATDNFRKIRSQTPEVFSDVVGYYLMDLCAVALWNDTPSEESERTFLKSVATTVQLTPYAANERLVLLETFAQKHAADLDLFHFKHPVRQFYSQSAKTVQLLILRNKRRLLKEVSQSRELATLLGKSTYADLDKTERKKLRAQLLDICKTVPSLTIFLLPGGSLLLPLLVKFIPQLLPDAFNDNRIPN